ncbi:hypothetical protein Hanom_Chr03g00181961 [Helianthus anomalus]
MSYKVQITRPSMYFWKKLGTNALQSTNHRDHLCTFGKLGTKSKVLVNHRDHPCTILFSLTKETFSHLLLELCCSFTRFYIRT